MSICVYLHITYAIPLAFYFILLKIYKCFYASLASYIRNIFDFILLPISLFIPNFISVFVSFFFYLYSYVFYFSFLNPLYNLLSDIISFYVRALSFIFLLVIYLFIFWLWYQLVSFVSRTHFYYFHFWLIGNETYFRSNRIQTQNHVRRLLLTEIKA